MKKLFLNLFVYCRMSILRFDHILAGKRKNVTTKIAKLFIILRFDGLRFFSYSCRCRLLSKN